MPHQQTFAEFIPEYLEVIRELMADWSCAFEGTPEAQMVALELLDFTFESVARGDGITMLCIAEAVHAPKPRRGSIMLRLFGESDFVSLLTTPTKEAQQWN